MRPKSHGSSPSRRYAFDLMERREGNGLDWICIHDASTGTGISEVCILYDLLAHSYYYYERLDD